MASNPVSLSTVYYNVFTHFFLVSDNDSEKTPPKENQNENENTNDGGGTLNNSKPTKASTSGHKHACDYCGKEFRTKPCMEAHRLEIHLGVVVPKVPCTICGTW